MSLCDILLVALASWWSKSHETFTLSLIIYLAFYPSYSLFVEADHNIQTCSETERLEIDEIHCSHQQNQSFYYRKQSRWSGIESRWSGTDLVLGNPC